MTKIVKVKAKEGRIARTSPRGEFIPEDRFIPVVHTNYIDRLINVHGDLIRDTAVQPSAPKKTTPTVAPNAEKASIKKETN